MTPPNDILMNAEAHVTRLLTAKLPPWAVYHNLEHTQEIVATAKEIADGMKLSKTEKETVLLAAWFHDTGYVDGMDGHEERSVQIAEMFLQEQNHPQEKIDEVAGCIRATKIPQKPETLLEQVVCDADLSHLGRKRFFDRSALLRMEIELRTGNMIPDDEWLRRNIAFATETEFFTEYAREEYAKRRKRNLVELQEQLRVVSRDSVAVEAKKKIRKEKAAAKEERDKRPDRGIETMFRVVPKNHLDLTALADHKSNILIGTNGTILAIVFSLLVSKLDTHPYLLIPTIILILVTLTTMVFAILATRPNVTAGQFTREDIRQRKVNLLFFGNFYRSSLEDFDWGMREMMNDREYLYGSMIKDLYFLGKVLAVKFRYLRIAYTIFMWGLIAAVIAFAIAILTAPVPVAFPMQ